LLKRKGGAKRKVFTSGSKINGMEAKTKFLVVENLFSNLLFYKKLTDSKDSVFGRSSQRAKYPKTTKT